MLIPQRLGLTPAPYPVPARQNRFESVLEIIHLE
jgi:hypothetical protein